MQDESAVRVRNGSEHLKEQPHASLYAQSLRIAPAVDRLAFDVLKNEIRLPGDHTCIDQVSDVPMRQFRERIGLVSQALGAAAAERIQGSAA